MSARAEEIANQPHERRHQICTKAEWSGYLWWLHDRDERYRPKDPGAEDGIRAAQILIERDKAKAP